MATWTEQELKANAVSETWDSANVTWADADYDWVGKEITTWTFQSEN
jgi:hypothetical protein